MNPFKRGDWVKLRGVQSDVLYQVANITEHRVILTKGTVYFHWELQLIERPEESVA